MSIVKIPEERKEQFTLELHPEIVYLSSSIEIPKHGIKIGVTGSAPLRRRPSKCIKELEPLEDPQMQGVAGSSTSTFDESKKKKSVNLKRAQDEAARANVEGFSANVYSWLNQYMTEVNLSPQPAANTKKIFITRFDPPFTHDDISVEKSIIKNNLMTFYESTFDLCEMSFLM